MYKHASNLWCSNAADSNFIIAYVQKDKLKHYPWLSILYCNYSLKQCHDFPKLILVHYFASFYAENNHDGIPVELFLFPIGPNQS